MLHILRILPAYPAFAYSASVNVNVDVVVGVSVDCAICVVSNWLPNNNKKAK